MESAEPRRLKVLVVEDQALIAQLVAQMIEELDGEVVGPVKSVRRALQAADENRPDLAIVDLTLPDGSGEDLIRQLRLQGVSCAVHTGHDRPTPVPDGLADIPWLLKPISEDQLRKLVAATRPKG